MTDNYKKCLVMGLEYQDFIFDQLRRMDGMPIFLGSYASEKYQYCKGESLSGLEIKYDDKMKETKNLFIEYKEKTNPNNQEFIPSGIMRVDNTWLYLIGDYEQAFIFAKKTLQGYYLTYENKLEKRLSSTKTSWGFLLPIEKVLKHSFLLARHITFKQCDTH